ncbi:MAG: DUF1330 domain-containing protein [Gaiellaceae bacterium]
MSTLLVTATPAEGQQEAQGRYLKSVGALLIGAGGKPVKRLRITQSVSGDATTKLALVMDFDNAEAISALFESDAYRALEADRNQGFASIDIFITEDAD